MDDVQTTCSLERAGAVTHETSEEALFLFTFILPWPLSGFRYEIVESMGRVQRPNAR